MGGIAAMPMDEARGAGASLACALLAGLTLLALAVDPRREPGDAATGWRLVLVAGMSDPAPQVRAAPRPQPVEATEDFPPLVLDVQAPAPRLPGTAPHIDLRSYALEAVRDGGVLVPRLLFERLPASLPELDAGELRKRLFIKAMLPSLLAENERLAERRRRLLEILAASAAGDLLLDSERLWLETLADSYRVGVDDRIELLRRVDTVPPSLALAQAALESGWGTSRGAQQAHSMFGHMAVSDDAARGVLRRFDSLADAIAAYVHNLNTHRAYAAFREARARHRAQNLSPDVHELAGALLRYSERGGAYVRDVRVLIRANRLDGFDRARLGG